MDTLKVKLIRKSCNQGNDEQDDTESSSSNSSSDTDDTEEHLWEILIKKKWMNEQGAEQCPNWKRNYNFKKKVHSDKLIWISRLQIFLIKDMIITY